MDSQQKYDSLKSDFDKVADQLKIHSAHVSIYQIRAWKEYKAELNKKLEALQIQIQIIQKINAQKQLHHHY